LSHCALKIACWNIQIAANLIQDQVVDFFIKLFLHQSLSLLLSKLGLIDIYQPPTVGAILHHK